MSTPANWPLVDSDDDGIRPAGRPDECFYCRQRVGQPHGPQCVVVTKLIEMRVTAQLQDGTSLVGTWQLTAPHYWTADSCEFHRNESSWCAGNLLADHNKPDVTWEAPDAWERLTKEKQRSCLCDVLQFKFIRVIDDTPQRKLRTVYH